MKRLLLIIIWALFWLVLESTWLNSFPTNSIRLDMVFVSVLAIGFISEIESGLLPAFVMGIIADAFSPAPFGTLTFIYIAAYWVVRFATSAIYLRSYVARFVWTAAASIGAIWLKAALFALFFKNPQFLAIALWRFLPQAAWNGALGIIVIPFFKWYISLSWDKIFKEEGLVLK